jgi:26S proteasome regulatory subunit N7
LAAYQVAYDKTAPLGHRIDIIFAQVRIGFFSRDNELCARKIERVKQLIEEGGDWDRRNRLKVYEGIFRSSIRDFKGAVTPLLDSLATFTSTELMEYRDFVRYVTLAAALSLTRAEFKQKVILSPEILEAIHETPFLSDFANSLYNCQYDKFFVALAEMEKSLKLDHLLYRHTAYYVREMRIIAYNQLLVSYKSLTLQSMAASFGVTESFIDA